MTKQYVVCRKCGAILGEWNYPDCEIPRFELCVSCFFKYRGEREKSESELIEDEWNEMVNVYE